MLSTRDIRFLALVGVFLLAGLLIGKLWYGGVNVHDRGYTDFTPSPMPTWEREVKNTSKWIVITTIQLPTKPVETLSKLPGWSVVVVGDTKTPSNWAHPNCVFLSVERQRELNYRIHRLLPYRAYSRKNIGYIFAVRHGAKVIYETDDDNDLIAKSIDEAFQVDLKHLNENMLVYATGKRTNNSSDFFLTNSAVHNRTVCFPLKKIYKVV